MASMFVEPLFGRGMGMNITAQVSLQDARGLLIIGLYVWFSLIWQNAHMSKAK